MAPRRTWASSREFWQARLLAPRHMGAWLNETSRHLTIREEGGRLLEACSSVKRKFARMRSLGARMVVVEVRPSMSAQSSDSGPRHTDPLSPLACCAAPIATREVVFVRCPDLGPPMFGQRSA